MEPEVPEELLRQAEEWDLLHRWERRELGKALRRLGLTYSEIQTIIPVPKGTLSGWCRDVELTVAQIAAIKQRTPSQGVPKDTQWRRRLEIQRIRSSAAQEAHSLVKDAQWTAGVVLYWGEGSKSDRRLAISNADPRLLCIFMRWVDSYLEATPEYSASLNLHANNDEPAARRYWATALTLPLSSFTKTYLKQDGTGHRKNHLRFGVCRLVVRRSTDSWIRTMTWIDVLASHLLDSNQRDTASLAPGR